MNEHADTPAHRTAHKKPLAYDREAEVVRQAVAPKVLGISVATILRRVRDDPDFPKRIKLGARANGFLRADLLNWLAKRAGEPMKPPAEMTRKRQQRRPRRPARG